MSQPSQATPGETLNVKADKTFTMVSGGQNVEGVWTVAGDKLSLTLTKVGDKTIEQVKQQLKSSFASVAKSMGSAPGAGDETAKIDAILDKMTQPMVFDLSDDFKSAKPDTTRGMFTNIPPGNAMLTKAS